MFIVFVVSVLIGWAFRLFWDLNHSYHWIPSGDFFWGTGIGVILFGCSIYIDSTVKRKMFRKRNVYWLSKTFTRFFLFTAISNLCDELFFDPTRTSAGEWIMAAIMWAVIHYYNTYYDRSRRMVERDID